MFYLKQIPRQYNDWTNSLRETILAQLGNRQIPQDYFYEPTFGSKWKHLHNEWKNVLESTLAPPKESFVSLIQKGGRTSNYDFLVHYTNQHEKKVEFKYNAQSIASLPQIMQLADKHTAQFLQETYSDFYYTHSLRSYLALDSHLSTLPIPTKPEYIQMVSGTNYTIHPLFDAMKQQTHFETAQKKHIVKTSIASFLKQYEHTLDIPTLHTMTMTRQQEKIFVLWKNEQFYIDELKLSQEEPIQSFLGIENQNRLVVQSNHHRFHFLLRWKNHPGILNPAWQISVASKKE
jgi:hypothetical protein